MDFIDLAAVYVEKIITIMIIKINIIINNNTFQIVKLKQYGKAVYKIYFIT